MTIIRIFLTACMSLTCVAVSATEDLPRVLRSFETGAAPHGMWIEDQTLYLAAAGDDRIEVYDLGTGERRTSWPVAQTPLDILRGPDGWLVTQFGGDRIVELDTFGAATGRGTATGKGPSLFAPTIHDGKAYVVSEFADRLSVMDIGTAGIVTTFPTGDRPYPAAVTRDGILAFVPNRDAGSVSVIDLLNGQVLREVDICARPEGGALTRNDTDYLVACGGDDRLVRLNTASFAVTGGLADGVGPRPFSVAITPDGRFGFTNNAGGDSVSIFDPATLKPLGKLTTGKMPIVMRLAGKRLFVANEGANTVTEIAIPDRPAPPSPARRNTVMILGTIHGGHETSVRYSLDVLEDVIRRFDPDYVIAEIPPNRFDAAMRGFRATGTVTEPRVGVFPEYTDTVFPLSREMGFEIIPAAAWTAPMNRYRASALERIANDPALAEEWARHRAARQAFSQAIGSHGDDPLFIHSDAYDRITEAGFAPYNRHFNDMLGPGGWRNINAAHYRLIAQALDDRSGEGVRILITFGSSHRYWFLDRLEQRTDIDLVDPDPFFRSMIPH